MSIKKQAFNKLYRDHYNKVNRLCLGYLGGNVDLAQDLLQEVFIKVWEHWDSFQGKAQRSTWLYRIAVNTCLQQLRNNNKFKVTSLENLKKDVVEEELVQKEEMYVQLYACMNKLNKENQTILLLELEGLPQLEIAAIIGIKHNALRTRLNRIKSQLTKCVNNENI
jgi:RNA polymerase sigma factor (sigma-70 family)